MFILFVMSPRVRACFAVGTNIGARIYEKRAEKPTPAMRHRQQRPSALSRARRMKNGNLLEPIRGIRSATRHPGQRKQKQKPKRIKLRHNANVENKTIKIHQRIGHKRPIHKSYLRSK